MLFNKNIFKKKILFIFIILIVFLLIILSLVFKKQKKQTENEVSLFPKEFLPVYIEGENKINFEIDKKTLDFPEKLPNLKKEILPPLSRTEAEQIAENLGFPNLPIVSKGVYPEEVLIWNNENYSLSIILNKRIVTYEPNIDQRSYLYTVMRQQFFEEDIENYVNNFLLDNFDFFISNLSLTKFTYLKRIEGSYNYEETDRNNSEILQLNYIDGESEYPILSSSSLQTNMNVQIMKDKTILLMQLELLGKFFKSNEEFVIKNYEEIVNESKNAKIISMGDIYLDDIDLSDIKNISINEITIAYYIEDRLQESMQPIYVFKGTAKVEKYNEELPIVLYLPAYK